MTGNPASGRTARQPPGPRPRPRPHRGPRSRATGSARRPTCGRRLLPAATASRTRTGSRTSSAVPLPLRRPSQSLSLRQRRIYPLPTRSATRHSPFSTHYPQREPRDSLLYPIVPTEVLPVGCLPSSWTRPVEAIHCPQGSTVRKIRASDEDVILPVPPAVATLAPDRPDPRTQAHHDHAAPHRWPQP
jgi:hypothetical protein